MSCQLFQPVGSHIPLCPSLGLSYITLQTAFTYVCQTWSYSQKLLLTLVCTAQRRAGKRKPTFIQCSKRKKKKRTFFLKFLVTQQWFPTLKPKIHIFGFKKSLQIRVDLAHWEQESLIWSSWAHSSDYKHKLHPPDVQACLQGPSNQNKAGLKASVHPLWFRRWTNWRAAWKPRVR